MMKRLLSLLMCLLMLESVALAVDEDSYSLPEVFRQQYEAAGNPIRGKFAIRVAGTAPWVEALMPLAASEIQLRLIRDTQSEDYQYEFFAEDAENQPLGTTNLYRAGDAIYLQSELLPNTLLTLPLNSDVLGKLLGDESQGNTSIYTAVLGILEQPGVIWQNEWVPVLAKYKADIETWLSQYASEPTVKGETGSISMQVIYTVPAEDIKEEAKRLWAIMINDADLLALLRPEMTAQQQTLYLNPALMYFYEACIDALPLEGSLMLSRQMSMMGETQGVAVAMPMPSNPWGFSRLSLRQEGDTLTLVLVQHADTLTLTLKETAEASKTVWDGSFTLSPAVNSAQEAMNVDFTLSREQTSYRDDNATRHEDITWALNLASAQPDEEDFFAGSGAALPPLNATLKLAYSREHKENTPVILNVSLDAATDTGEFRLRARAQTTNRWMLKELPTAGAESFMNMSEARRKQVAETLMTNVIYTMMGLNVPPETSDGPTVATMTVLPDLTEAPTQAPAVTEIPPMPEGA